MFIDKVKDMTLDNIPLVSDPKIRTQIALLKKLALQPEHCRFIYFSMPTDIRLHAKHSLLNKWREFEGLDVMSININDFTTELCEAIKTGSWQRELNRYKTPDILVVDDLQLLIFKEHTQEEFYVSVLKPRLEAGLLTVLFSEYDANNTLSPALRDDLRNLLRLSFRQLVENKDG